MRNPDRPSIQIFAKDVDSVESPIFTAIDASTVRLKIPLFVVLTLPKGISGGSTEDFDPKHYLQKEETAALANKLKERVSDLKLENATVGIAVNRFWRDSIGYENQANVIIAYVRKDVIYLKQIDVSKLDNRTVEQTVEMIQKLHHESTGGP